MLAGVLSRTVRPAIGIPINRTVRRVDCGESRDAFENTAHLIPRSTAAFAVIFLVLAACMRQRIDTPHLPSKNDGAARRYGNVNDARLAQAQKEPQNWPIYNGSWHELRYSFLDQINADNVSLLKPAWFVEFDTTRGQESTPLVVDGVMYVSTAWSRV